MISAGAHLVVKRGHHGRFRFAMMTDAGQLKGEVRVDVALDREAMQARALDEIATLAEALAGASSRRRGAMAPETTLDEPEPMQASRNRLFSSKPDLRNDHG